MSLTVNDLITAIKNQLNSGLDSNYCAKGTIVPGPPPIVNGAESLCDISSTDLNNVVINATVGKWRMEGGAGGPLKIKGAEMIKRTTGLEATEPD